MYAFPSPERPDRLVLVLNTLPMARPSDFSPTVCSTVSGCDLSTGRARTLSGWRFVPGEEELVLDCVFAAPGVAEGQSIYEQHGTCISPSAEPISFRVNDAAGRFWGRHPGLRRRPLGPVYHGCRGPP